MNAWILCLAVSSVALLLAGAESALARGSAPDTREWNDLNLHPPCSDGRSFCQPMESSRRTRRREDLVKLRDNFAPELQKSVDNL
jgi:hypothetical protein